MGQSKFRRPVGFDAFQNDPEESYRAGYQHGAREVLRALKSNGVDAPDSIKSWVEAALLKWRHDTEADPIPPKMN